MINGAHSIIYSTAADADRAFFRDVLKLPHVDTGAGWLIFAVQDEGWGLLTHLTLPSGAKLGVYQPRHARPENPTPITAAKTQHA